MEDFNKAIDQIKEKLGEEKSATISEELINIMGEHKTALDDNAAKTEEIHQLKQEKEDLIVTNGKLFQQIGHERDFTPAKPDDKQVEQNTELNINDIINQNGDLI